MPGFLFFLTLSLTRTPKSHHLTNSAARGRWRMITDIYGSLYESRVTKKKKRRGRNDWPIFLESSTPPDRDLQHNAVWLLFTPHTSSLCRMIERMTGRESPVIRSDFSDRRLICDRIYSSGEHVKLASSKRAGERSMFNYSLFNYFSSSFSI